MMKDKIGENAGRIWQLLNDEPGLPVKEAIRKANMSKDEFNMAIGWLFRENKVTFTEADKKQEVWLTD